MTARPPFDEHALDPEERELAARLAALDTGGPSAALDARILAAARAAVAPAATTPASRRPRRWPTAVGAAATLVIAVGLAWQLKPLFDLPPPLPRQTPSAGSADAEVLVYAEPMPAPPAAHPVEQAASDAAATAPAPSAAPARPRVAGSGATVRAGKVQPQARTEVAVASPSDDFVDEAVGDHADAAHAAVAAAPAAAPPPPPPAAVAAQAEERARFMDSRAASAREAQESNLDRVTVTGSRILRPVADDASLPPLEWLERIRERRDAGDLDGARDSLQRFVREYPRHRLPDDLRALRNAPR